jgi:transcriptional regulator with XRE-family HTH domain
VDQNKLRKNLRQFLNEKDMTLTKAGFYFGMTAATLSDFLAGKTNLNARSKYKIEKGLGLV